VANPFARALSSITNAVMPRAFKVSTILPKGTQAGFFHTAYLARPTRS
jgi:hypothetical protein